MDVPFSSSGAMSRAHYALVRKIETARSEVADQILLAEVHSIRSQLSRSTLTLKQCKECLVLLLYCSMAVNPGVYMDLEFALPHAINLAEAGQTTQDKRTGYLFCAEIMPSEHELQLMLVNSIRKDLESPLEPRICLALDTLIQSPSKDVIPAIQSRLHDLLSHSSPDVRRRTVLAFHKLAELEPEILGVIARKARKRLSDSSSAVVCAALTLTDSLLRAGHLPADKYHIVISALLSAVWSQGHGPFEGGLYSRIIRTITRLVPSSQDLVIIVGVVIRCVQLGPSAYSVLRECFNALSVSPKETLIAIQTSTGVSAVKEIRSLLTSQDYDSLYIFLCCLSSVDPDLWAGTTPEIPPVLEGWEVERIMTLLDCDDKLIRKQTLRTLWGVDRKIVEDYYARALQGDLSTPSIPGSEGTHLLDILDITCGENGELYTRQLKDVLKVTEGDGPLNQRTVSQEVVDELLSRVHAGDSDWRSGCIGVLFMWISDSSTELGPTIMVIVAALICEYLELSPTSPIELLRGLAHRLPSYSVAVQDACLVTMLRVSAAAEEQPTEVVKVVHDLRACCGRHLKRRCDQFLTLSQSKPTLQQVIAGAHSSSLPDFVFALEEYEADQKRASSRSPLVPQSPPLKPFTPEPSSSQASPIPHKLRYTAYEAPKPTPRLRRTSSSSSHGSEDGDMRRRSHQDMTVTVTPGDLTLAAQSSHPRTLLNISPPKTVKLTPLPIVQILDEEHPSSGPADLIALDSPFMSEPSVPSITGALNSIELSDITSR